MERLSTWVIALISVLSVWLCFHSAEGKCRGDWKSYHGCLGGNGKRSDPSLDQAPSAYDNSKLESLLRKELDSYRVAAAAADEDDDSDFVRAPETRSESRLPAYNKDTLENFLRKMVTRLSSKYDRK